MMSPVATEPIENETVPFDGITFRTIDFVNNRRQPEECVEYIRENFIVPQFNRDEILKSLKKIQWDQIIYKYEYVSICFDNYSESPSIGGYRVNSEYKIYFHNGPLNVKE